MRRKYPQKTETKIAAHKWFYFGGLSEYIAELRSLGHSREVLVDGSFVSAKASRRDIDLIVVYPEAFQGLLRVRL